jgi:hypothetical protein
MRQQINLYQPIFREERKALSGRSVAVGLALIVAGLAGVSSYAAQRIVDLEATVQTLRHQTAHQQEQLAQASDLHAARAKPADLEARIKKLRIALAEREQALQLLQSGTAGQTQGFAARMEALARRHVPGLWLDGVRLSGTSSTMSLQGSTTDPDNVPRYLRSLAEDAVLAGARFDEFVIQRPDAGQKPSTQGAEPNIEAESRPVRFSAGSTSLPSAESVAR